MKTTGYNSVKSWAITAACSFVECIVSIPIRVSAIFFVGFVSHYNTDRESATMFSLTYSIIRCFAGPLTGYLAEIFSLRSLTLAGCFFSSLGIGLCYFAKDIVTVTVLFGVIYGVGLGMGSTLMPQIIKQHFNKNLASANGFYRAGSKLGIFALIPLISLLLKQYDVSGALLIICGIMLHSVPVAVLLSDPKYKKEPQLAKATELNGKDTQQSIISETSIESTNRSLISVNEISLCNETSRNGIELNKCVNENCDATTKFHVGDDFQQTDIAHGITEHKLKRLHDCQQIEDGEDTIISETSRERTNRILISNNETSLCTETSRNCSELNKCVIENVDAITKSHAGDDFQKTNIAHGITEREIQRFNDCQEIEATPFNLSSRFEMEQDTKQEFNTLPNAVRVRLLRRLLLCASSSSSRKPNKYRNALRSLLVLKDPIFLIIMFCHSILAYVTKFIWTTTIEISRDKEIPQSQEQYLLMFPLLAETVGCTCLGWVTDKGYLTVVNYIAFGFFLMGFSCFTFVLANNFFTLMVANMAFGICLSGTTIAFPSLIYEFIEEKSHTMAIASKLVLYIPLSFTLVPLIGYFRGTLGSYDGALFLLTAICIGCSALLVLLPYISKCRKQTRQNSEENNHIT